MGSNGNMSKLLVKFPSRGRPDKFLQVFNMYQDSILLKDTTFFLVSIDEDDKSMVDTVSRLSAYPNTEVVIGPPLGKVGACNRDLAGRDWDILLLASDDMIPQVKGMDKIIIDLMNEHFPDGDGALWFNDGYTRDLINTIVCLGRKYYDRFGYLYHPAYKSLFADNEYTAVGMKLGKLKYIPQVIMKHQHPMRIKTEKYDDLYKYNESFWREDQAMFNKRRKEGFV